jgi:hypothetical protein
MRELGFVAAVILILCVITYWTRQTAVSLPSAANSANSEYAPAIKAAQKVKHIADAESRRRWVLSLQLTGAQSAEPQTYTTEGDNAEILVVTSSSADSAFCSAFANGEHGSAAAAIGFIQVNCRNSSTDAVYRMPISLAR